MLSDGTLAKIIERKNTKDTDDGFSKIIKKTKKVLACFFGFFPSER